MKNRIVQILLLLISTLCYAQQKVAILEPLAGENVSSFEKAMVRGELRKAISRVDGYEPITRSDMDQVLEELDFQHMGYVPKKEIHRLGQISGADYLCISTLNKSDAQFYIEAYLVEVSTGDIESPASQLGEVKNGNMVDLYSACQTLIRELIGSKAVTGGIVLEETFDGSKDWGWTCFSHNDKSVQIANDALRIVNYAKTGTTRSDVVLPMDVEKNFKITFQFVIQEVNIFSSVGIVLDGNNVTAYSGSCSYQLKSGRLHSTTDAKIGMGRNKPVLIEFTKHGDQVSIQVNGATVCKEEECAISSSLLNVFAGINTVAMLRKVTIEYIK